jgi:hypothetical protein
LTYANVMATIAVFVVLGGGAYAALNLSRDSVRSRHIVDGQIRDADLAAGIPSGLVVVNNAGGNSSENKSVDVECPDGKEAIGGGASAPTGGATGFVALTASHPASNPPFNFEGWHATAIEVNGGSAQTWGIQVFAICARP